MENTLLLEDSILHYFNQNVFTYFVGLFFILWYFIHDDLGENTLLASAGYYLKISVDDFLLMEIRDG